VVENALNSYMGKMTGKVSGIIQSLRSEHEEQSQHKDIAEMIRCVHQAKEEWCQAEQYFDNVSDPDLVDYAIYRIEASKKKYDYMLKKAKEMGIRVDMY
jgi:protein subunit release factor A